jgi:hypothetical protein
MIAGALATAALEHGWDGVVWLRPWDGAERHTEQFDP